jgi:translation initiation factor 1 (eIF-1/SUI1)
VTVAGPLHIGRGGAGALLRELKRRGGSGGTLRGGAGETGFTLEIQGDHVENVLGHLAGLGYPAKRAGR